MDTAFLADPIAKQHDPGQGHPEQPARWDAAIRGLGAYELTNVPIRAATEDELALMPHSQVHRDRAPRCAKRRTYA